MSFTSTENSSGTDVKCHRCGYSWEYSGEMQMVTCPSCQSKTPASDESEE